MRRVNGHSAGGRRGPSGVHGVHASCSALLVVHRVEAARRAHGGDRGLLVEHRHARGERHVVKDRINGRADAVARWAGERGRIDGVMPRVSSQFPRVGHVGQAESRVSRRVHDQNAATLHSIDVER